MPKLVTLQNYRPDQIAGVVRQLRRTFADVFSVSYANQLHQRLEPALVRGEFKEAEELKESKDPVLKGFSDLLCKKQFFDKPLDHYRDKQAIQTIFHTLYKGVGFDDDAAFILAFHDFAAKDTALEETKKSESETKTVVNREARAHFQNVRSRLSAGDCNEIVEYLDFLDKINRKLLKLGFVALLDKDKTMVGFAIYHLLQTEHGHILHVRQAAMRHQGLGYASVMANYLTDHFPYAKYEANQRRANNVLMKRALVKEGILVSTNAVLGYNNAYYLGLLGKDKILKSFQDHYAKKNKRNKIPKVKYPLFGLYHHDDLEVRPFFSQNKLNRDTLRDDTCVTTESSLKK